MKPVRVIAAAAGPLLWAALQAPAAALAAPPAAHAAAPAAPPATQAGAPAAAGAPLLDASTRDTTCAPCRDFYQHANGGWLRRTEVEWAEVCERDPTLRRWDERPDVVEQVVLEAKYSGYIERQAEEVARFRRLEDRRIPAHFDYAAVPQLRQEAREKLARVRPASLGQAGRISGITPADLAVLLFYLD